MTRHVAIAGHSWRWLAHALSALSISSAVLAVACAAAAVRASAADNHSFPARLSETGLYVEGSTTQIQSRNLPYSPQYPLWSDGAGKRRWIHLPPGTTIDGTQPDGWQFPKGTRFWKEFSFGQRRVETRLIERLADGTWDYATYIWNEDGTDTRLAPIEGVRELPVLEAPGRRYAIPSREDCTACHEGSAVPVLGFSALQLSPDRDPLAPHTEPSSMERVDLAVLIERNLITGLPHSYRINPPRIAAPTPRARAALGYLHGNCGHCHNSAGPLAMIDLALDQRASTTTQSVANTVRTLLAGTSEFRQGAIDRRVVPGHAEVSAVVARMRSTEPLFRMPPVGTRVMDAAGVALIERWIDEDLRRSQEYKP